MSTRSKRSDAARRRSGGAFVLSDTQPAHVSSVLAIDPGAAKKNASTGMALWGIDHEQNGPNKQLMCTNVWSELAPDALDFMIGWTSEWGPRGVLVIEEFRLYPWASQEQGFTSLAVVEVIGALRWNVLQIDEANRPAVVMQGAHIKKAGQRYMDEEGIEAIGPNQHARDAEMHGWYWVGRKWHGR